MPLARPSTAVRVLLASGGAALAGALLLAGPSSSAATALQARPTAAEQRAVTLRSQLGLANGLDYVRSLEAPGRGTTATDLGIPVTAAEHSELQRRQRLGASIRLIDKQFAMNTAYAGAWLDQAAGGVLHVAFTRPLASASRATLTAMVPGGETPDVTVAHNSLQQLTAILDHVTADMVTATERKLPTFANAGIDLAANTVRITILSSAPAGTEQDVLAAYGPDGVTVARGEAATPESGRNYTSGRLFGGEYVESSAARCTATYTDAKSTYNETYSITAGHCGPNGTRFYQGSSSTRSVGTVHANGVYGHPSTMCDCAPLGPTPVPGFGTNQVLVNGNNLLTITGSQYTYQGEFACHSGAHSYSDYDTLQCGTVMDNAYTAYVGAKDGSPAFILYDCVETNAHVEEGDSGAPFIVGSTLVGMVSSGINGTITIFSRIQHLSDVGLHLSYST